MFSKFSVWQEYHLPLLIQDGLDDIIHGVIDHIGSIDIFRSDDMPA